MLISPVGNVIPRLEQLRRRGIPTVLVDRQADNLSFSSVAVDDLAGGEMAVAHLLSVGRRRIAFVGGPESIRQVADRLSGARKAVEAVPGATLEVVATESLTVLSGRAAGEAIRRRSAAERPDAIFAANDLLAVGVLQGLMLMGGVQVPQEIALIGYDDIEFAAAAVVPLSSIRQPSALIGSTALELLFREATPEAGFVPRRSSFPLNWWSGRPPQADGTGGVPGPAAVRRGFMRTYRYWSGAAGSGAMVSVRGETTVSAAIASHTPSTSRQNLASTQ